MQLTNKFVSDNASVVCDNDLKAKEALKSTQAVLEEVSTSSNGHSELTASFASRSLATVSEMKQIDDQTLEVVKAVERDEKACSSSLINTIYKPISADMKNTMQLGLDTIALMNDTMVPNIIGDLERRKVITNQMSERQVYWS